MGVKRPSSRISKKLGSTRAKPMLKRAHVLAKSPAHEPGYKDTAIAAYAVSTTATVTLLNPVAQGASVSQRIGKKINLVSLQIRGLIGAPSSATSHLFSECTMLIVYDRKPTGALPAITDILDSASPHSMNKDDNAARFRIVRRSDVIVVGNAANNIEMGVATNVDAFIKLKGLHTVYKSAATGTIGDIETGALYLVTVGTASPGATLQATLECSFRLRYVD